MNDERKYPAAKIHSIPKIAWWCRYGFGIGPWVCVWWGRYGHFLSTLQLTHAAKLDRVQVELDEARASSASETALREARAAATAREEALRKVANDERDSHRALLPVLAAADYLIDCYRNLGKHPVRGLPEAEAAYDSARAALRDETGGGDA